MKTLGFIFQTAPHGSAAGREGVDAIMAAAAYCEQIKVFFVADGVLQLLPDQAAEQIHSRAYTQSFKLFDLYDIEEVFVCSESLQARSLLNAELLIDAASTSPEDIRHQLGACDNIMVF